MKKFSRILAMFLALVSVLAITACGPKSGPKYTATLSSEDANRLENIMGELDSIEQLSNKTLKWFSHYDINPSQEGDQLPVSLYLFQEKFGAHVEWVQTDWSSRYTNLANLILSGDSPDFYTCDGMDTFPMVALKNMMQPIDNYIDFESDMWKDMKNIADMYMFDGHYYCAPYAVANHGICIYNRQTIEDNGLEDPADLFAKGEWNWDTFKEMCVDFTDEEELKYALDGYWFPQLLMNSGGATMISMKDGVIQNNINTPEMEKAQNFMSDLAKLGVVYPRQLYNWAIRENTFYTGETLFWLAGPWYFGKGNAQKLGGDNGLADVMFVPVPKDPDLDYYPVKANVYGYYLIKDAPNPLGYAAFMACNKIANQSTESKEISIAQLKNDGWTDEQIEMMSTIDRMAMEHPVIEFYAGVSTEVESLIYGMTQEVMIPAEKTWAQLKEERSEAIAQWLQVAIDKYKK